MVETLRDRLQAEDSGFRFARNMAAMSQSGLRDLMARASRPGVLSFAVGLPAAELTLVQLATSDLGTVVDSRTTRELPLNGRSWTDLATLQPGVAAVETQASYSAAADRG